ncbi:MAG: glutaredoxin domain-containing protein [Pseudomonadota bacterium]
MGDGGPVGEVLDSLANFVVGEDVDVFELDAHVVEDVNVLADDQIRQGIKDFSDWPTVPQLYVKGEFVGGCDIITEMTLSGELDKLFDAKSVTYSKEAADKIREANG